MTCTTVVPETLKLLCRVGWRTMMGPGPGIISIAHSALACTSWVFDPVRKEAKKVLTRSVTLTWTKGCVPAMALGGAEIPGAEVGKLTETSFESAPAVRPGLE